MGDILVPGRTGNQFSKVFFIVERLLSMSCLLRLLVQRDLGGI